MTKTEQKLIALATESSRRQVAVTGTRERAAGRKLLASGVFEFVTSYTEWETSRGRTTTYSTTVYRIK